MTRGDSGGRMLADGKKFEGKGLENKIVIRFREGVCDPTMWGELLKGQVRKKDIDINVRS